MSREDGSPRDALALRVITTTRRDAIETIQAAYPAGAVRLLYSIDMRTLELLSDLRDGLPPDSPVWSEIEALERSIDAGESTAIPVEAAAEASLRAE